MENGATGQGAVAQDVSVKDLSKYDIILCLDRSGSMNSPYKAGQTATRWQVAKESVLGLAMECMKHDSNGIDIIMFNESLKTYNNVTDDHTIIDRIFNETQPQGGTDTALVIETVCNNYLQNPAKPIIILCLTDGEPTDKKALTDAIIKASNAIKSDNEIGISFIQVGDDAEATAYLKSLDDDLTSQGAKFDIVDTITLKDMGSTPLVEVLLGALND